MAGVVETFTPAAIATLTLGAFTAIIKYMPTASTASSQANDAVIKHMREELDRLAMKVARIEAELTAEREGRIKAERASAAAEAQLAMSFKEAAELKKSLAYNVNLESEFRRERDETRGQLADALNNVERLETALLVEAEKAKALALTQNPQPPL